MPWVPDRFLDCVVYLYPSEAEAEDGVKAGGTGFLVGAPIDSTWSRFLLFVVTNRHVIDNGAMTVRLNNQAGAKSIIALDGVQWFCHHNGDDVAVCPIGLDIAHHKFTFIKKNEFLLRNEVGHHGVGPGDDVFMCGRFISREGKQRNLVTVRFGTIAQMPWEPIVDEESGFPQEAYMVECKSMAGYSGSPVFFWIPASPPLPNFRDPITGQPVQWTTLNPKRTPFPVPTGPQLLGINYCHIYSFDKVYDSITGKPVPSLYVKGYTGMSGVIPAWKITEIIEGELMKPLFDAASMQAGDFSKRADQTRLDVSASADDANPNHLNEFMRLVDLASRNRP
jgi:hypothetical protein